MICNIKNYKNKILHVCTDSPIISKYSDFLVEHINCDNNIFLVGKSTYQNELNKNLIQLKSSNFVETIAALLFSKKIIIHGLWSNNLIVILMFLPFLLKKSYWVMWGGDFYCFNIKPISLRERFFRFLRRKVIKKMGYLISYIPKDIQFVREHCNARGVYQECIMYPSNTFLNLSSTSNEHDFINVQVGNSADPTNEHQYIFDKLALCNNLRIKVHAPLSYGDKKYAEEIKKSGMNLFNDRFFGLTELLPYDEYTDWLSKIDIAIFAHKRQQGMGNTITLLGMGKKVFVRGDTAQFHLFKELGIDIFEIDNCDPTEITNINGFKSDNNQTIITDFFSREKLVIQWKNILL